MTHPLSDPAKVDKLHALQLMRDMDIVNDRTIQEFGPLPVGGLPVTPRRKPNLPHDVSRPVIRMPVDEDPQSTTAAAVPALPPLPPPPIPQLLRDMLKDHPGYTERLQEALDKAVQDAIAGNLAPFDEAVRALEGRLETFVVETLDELEAAENEGDADPINRAEEKLSLMRRARRKSGGMAETSELSAYFETHSGHFKPKIG
jgi:hypothetical protein